MFLKFLSLALGQKPYQKNKLQETINKYGPESLLQYKDMDFYTKFFTYFCENIKKIIPSIKSAEDFNKYADVLVFVLNRVSVGN